MSFPPVFHDICESLRFGRVLPVEIAPGPPAGRPCRYCDLLGPTARRPRRAHFSAPSVAARAILGRLERGAAVDAVVLGGPGDPLRHLGIGSILRRLRADAHVATILRTDGVLLADRDVRREAGEAETVVAALPALEDRTAAGDPIRRREAYERHLEGIASLRRETPARIGLEIAVWPGVNDGEASRAAWQNAARRVRPDRVFVMGHPRAEGDPGRVLEAVRRAIHPAAGAFLPDGTPIDQLCHCES